MAEAKWWSRAWGVAQWVVDVEERGTQKNAQQLRVALFESTFHFPGGMNLKHEINPQSPFVEMKSLETSEHMAFDPFIFYGFVQQSTCFLFVSGAQAMVS